jgi:hypothetical protein
MLISAGSKMEGSCRFGAWGAMIYGKKLPLSRAGLCNLLLVRYFGKYDTFP